MNTKFYPHCVQQKPTALKAHKWAEECVSEMIKRYAACLLSFSAHLVYCAPILMQFYSVYHVAVLGTARKDRRLLHTVFGQIKMINIVAHIFGNKKKLRRERRTFTGM